MTYLMGLVLIIAILFWIVGSRYEWSIPLKWIAFIGAWKDRLSNKSHSLTFVWELGPKSREMEKHFWLLQKALPKLQKKYKLPLWIEVHIHPDLSPGQKEKYISCLQRRFLKIKINGHPRHVEEKNALPRGSEQEERSFYALFSDVKRKP